MKAITAGFFFYVRTYLIDAWTSLLLFGGSVQTPKWRKPAPSLACGSGHGLSTSSHSSFASACCHLITARQAATGKVCQNGHLCLEVPTQSHPSKKKNPPLSCQSLPKGLNPWLSHMRTSELFLLGSNGKGKVGKLNHCMTSPVKRYKTVIKYKCHHASKN
jgi:hypothetical protein